MENLRSGAKVEELGGVGSERVPEKPRPSPVTGTKVSAPVIVSPLLSSMVEGLGVLLGGP